jgi:hypothetical protein
LRKDSNYSANEKALQEVFHHGALIFSFSEKPMALFCRLAEK